MERKSNHQSTSTLSPEEELSELLRTIQALRHPKTGCPWDLKQTHHSLLPYLIEESYEFLSACEASDDAEMNRELGDVLLQVVLHSQLASEREAFDFASVAKTIREKMIRRHPHVFAGAAGDLDSIEKNWEKTKQEERGAEELFPESLMNFPALKAAQKIGKRSHSVGFDWDNSDDVWKKVEEEFKELQQALADGEEENIKEEFGDLVFSLAQYARHRKWDAEELGRQGGRKFLNRFKTLEKIAQEKALSWNDLKKSDKEQLWQEAKHAEKAK